MASAARLALKSGETALDSVFALPSGARYYGCALQVNPYTYVTRHRQGATPYADEAHIAIVAACLDEDIEAIAQRSEPVKKEVQISDE